MERSVAAAGSLGEQVEAQAFLLTVAVLAVLLRKVQGPRVLLQVLLEAFYE